MKARVLIIGLVLAAFAANAQLTIPQVVPCGTMEQDSINRLKYPEMGTLDDLELAITRKMTEQRIRNNGRTQAVVLTIPIVVHVVHNGEAVGTGANISQAQIQSQIDVLNEDFRRKIATPGFNDSPVGADIEVEFCLSPVDEAGRTLAEPGIHRVRGANLTWTKNQIDGSLKPTTIWNTNLFYNIWTVKFGGENANLLGYAQFPDQSGLSGINENGGPATTDGVVVQYSSFGSIDKGNFPLQAPANHGRTLSHETGHWLGLRHIWGDGPCANDFVDDTPIQHGENRGCPVTKLSCDGISVEMPQNYMDYSDDACMNIFTKGQKARILAVLELSPRRKVLTQSTVCNTNTTDPPVASFSANKTTVLKGGEVIFTDLSANFPTTWKWTFEGGDPNTSNVRNPHVKYNIPGVYKVTLISANAKGESAPFTKEAYISVSTEGLCGTLTNYDASYTSSLIRLSDFGNYKGFLTGHNSLKDKAVSEVFSNPQGYAYVSGVKIRFGKAYSTKSDATATITVWNARGAQNGPGSVIEQKVVLLKQIQEDIAKDQPTSVVFDRETPVFSRSFHVGIELTYAGDSLAVKSSANGEATKSTSWVQSSTGVWNPYSIAYGASMAMDITAVVGMSPSVQVSSSRLLVKPGEEVILNARGASIFVWNSSDNNVKGVAGPQIIVNPTKTTTYETTGSGLELCITKTITTIYVDGVTGVEDALTGGLTVYPNPGTHTINLQMENAYRGDLRVNITNAVGKRITGFTSLKQGQLWNHSIEVPEWASGIYLISVTSGDGQEYVKWVKAQ